MSYIILFDGVCNLCNSTVNFIIDRDSKDIFRFAALQSMIGQKLLTENGISVVDMNSVILLKEGKVFQKSTAALEIARELDSVYSYFYILIYIPVPIRDFFYDLIAKNRYTIFGKKDSCRLPTPDLQKKFL